MQIITIELTGSNSLQALKDLEQKDLIRIINDPEVEYYSLPGEPISDNDFINWIEYTENSPTVNLIEAKQQLKTKSPNSPFIERELKGSVWGIFNKGHLFKN